MRVFFAVSRHNTTLAPEANATEHGAHLVVCKWPSVSPEQVDRELIVFSTQSTAPKPIQRRIRGERNAICTAIGFLWMKTIKVLPTSLDPRALERTKDHCPCQQQACPKQSNKQPLDFTFFRRNCRMWKAK